MRITFFIACLLLSGWMKAADVLLYPVEASAVKSTVFAVQINGQDVFTQSFKDIHYIRFAQKNKITLVITCAGNINDLDISPKRDIGKEQVSGNKLTIELTRSGYHIITFNKSERLFILADEFNQSAVPSNNKNWVNIQNFGVNNTGAVLATAAIQKAIDEATKQKKILYFPPGIYKTGTLKIPANANIYISAGALIKGSENREDYPVDEGKKESDLVNDKEHYTDNGERMTFSRLLLIDGVSNVKIWGAGIIDGSGSIVRAQGKPANLIRIRNSKKVLIEGLLLRDPACWNTHILYSEDVIIRNIKMINDRSVANTDGFDPDASKNVLIEHCFAYCSDDNIAIKTTNNGGLLQNCENITVQHCVFLTKKSALKVGTETKGAIMQNILFKNNYIAEADRGMALYCNDGAIFQNIRFVNNYFEKGYPDSQRKAIHFQIKNRSGSGQIKNILIKNCVFSENFHAASEITGLDTAHSINGIRFEKLTIGKKLCLSLQDLNVKTNEYVQNISFEK
ncbi:MAG TPA: glycosyl hydrolase family 28 protein [Chitinophagaceae bacterium]